jgi:hypothetical protein
MGKLKIVKEMVVLCYLFLNICFLELDNIFNGTSLLSEEGNEVSGVSILQSIRRRKELQFDPYSECDEENTDSNVFAFH